MARAERALEWHNAREPRTPQAHPMTGAGIVKGVPLTGPRPWRARPEGHRQLLGTRFLQAVKTPFSRINAELLFLLGCPARRSDFLSSHRRNPQRARMFVAVSSESSGSLPTVWATAFQRASDFAFGMLRKLNFAVYQTKQPGVGCFETGHSASRGEWLTSTVKRLEPGVCPPASSSPWCCSGSDRAGPTREHYRSCAADAA